MGAGHCGPVGKRKGEAALDAWSWVHLAGGALIGLTGLLWPWALGLIVGFEVLEGGLRRIKRDGEGLFEYESWTNIAADIVVGAVGYFLGRYAAPFHWPFS
jgi:hypothetical protein